MKLKLKSFVFRPLLSFALLVGGACGALLSACDLTAFDINPEEPLVVVVGAGMSGLSAAATLIERNKQVLVLEGSDVVGGRMRTKSNFGVPAGDIFKGTIELGANWFYGGYGELDEFDDPKSGPINPMKNFALEAGEGIAFMEELFTGKSIDIYDLTRKPNKCRLKFGEVQSAFSRFTSRDNCLYRESLDLFYELGDNPENAAGSDNVREVLDQCKWKPKTPVDDVLEVVYYDNELLSPPNGASQLSFTPWGYIDFGEQILFVYGQNGGMAEVARSYAEHRGVLERIIYNAMVDNIDYTGDDAYVTVTIEGNQCSIEASKVIFTGSQGYIDKYNSPPAPLPGLFTPPLDTTKRQIELRTWVKIFFQFPKAFWNAEPRQGGGNYEQFLYIFTADENNRKGCNVWMNFDYENPKDERYTLMPGCRILMGWVPQHIMDAFGGAENYVFDDTDLLSPSGDVQRILQPLKDAFPESFENPDYVFATTWQDDMCTYGSWNSFKDDESLDNNDYYDYYNPRNDTLWISGASSCRRHYRNMHGAHFAGVRDGNWVANCLEDSNSCQTRPMRPEYPEQYCDTYEFILK